MISPILKLHLLAVPFRLHGLTSNPSITGLGVIFASSWLIQPFWVPSCEPVPGLRCAAAPTTTRPSPSPFPPSLPSTPVRTLIKWFVKGPLPPPPSTLPLCRFCPPFPLLWPGPSSKGYLRRGIGLLPPPPHTRLPHMHACIPEQGNRGQGSRLVRHFREIAVGSPSASGSRKAVK